MPWPKEIVFSSRREGVPPPSRPDIERVTSLRVLGVIVNDKLTAADHVTMLLQGRLNVLGGPEPARLMGPSWERVSVVYLVPGNPVMHS